MRNQTEVKAWGGHDVWIKRMRKVTQSAVDPHHTDFLDNTMNIIKEDVRMWDNEITEMLCMLRKVLVFECDS